MVAATGQGELRIPRTRPEAGGHRHRLESCEATGDLLRTLLIRGKTSQLEDNQVTDQHQSGLDSGVKPPRELGKASVSDPGPSSRIEESRAIELRKRLNDGGQERSRPAATS